MFDPTDDTPIPLADAAARLPHVSRGRPVSPGTLRSWCVRGLRGIRLESARIGGRRITSQAALHRFFTALDTLDRQMVTG